MKRRVLLAGGIVLLIGIPVLVACGGATPAKPTQPVSSIPPTSNARGPQPITFTTPSANETEITSAPRPTDVALFADPSQPAYDPKIGFAPDAQRTLDLVTLQTALEQYRVAKGRYPSMLDALFPQFAPLADGQRLSAPPTDPQTRKPYSYQVNPDGLHYQLSATLTSGKQYIVTQP